MLNEVLGRIWVELLDYLLGNSTDLSTYWLAWGNPTEFSLWWTPSFLLGVASSVLRPSIRCQCLRDAEAVEALAKEGDEVLSSPLSCEDLEPIAESVYHQTEVVSLQGEEVGADVLERVLRSY